ncbi:hypothetical protein N1030_15390 [Desulfovibrio mangrovi]|uniref:hypothetical protein n=1 Tax=Desulfovibrio mangrovi TaxID=2976983 RepID=UPI002246575C|nr:hypothetical protein [Desulfovibrio mangrovi]UZP66974.1 hypothetical protein N1030_15390 [Desulfovibrio mangrovi]
MITAGVQQLNLPERIANAKCRIWFHAPPYGRFAASAPLCDALHAALSRADGPNLTVATLPDLDSHPQIAWLPDFMRLLRPRSSRDDIRQELAASHTFLGQLADHYGHRVSIHTILLRPSLPVLLVDDTICFGHFARSAVMTPDGFWCTVTAPVERLLQLAGEGVLPDEVDTTRTSDALNALSPEHRAAFRIIEECVSTTRTAASTTMLPKPSSTKP